MGKEIERKFLVKNDSFKKLAEAEVLQQGFLSVNKNRVVRVRISRGKAWLTIKGITKGSVRHEFEYDIPIKDAQFMINNFCKKPVIIKKRYRIQHGELYWEVDEFLNDNQGLVIAEIELNTEDQDFDKPDWVGEEVTENKKYYNAYLIKHPYSTWE
jgi:adenylate cyclase